jgi:tRNA(Arg) A34 adenosine deaminase TadA
MKRSKMSDEYFMNLAIKEAREAESKGNLPIGTIISKNDKVIATGWSSVGSELDPSGHNDLNCIRAACKFLNSLDLSNCTMYSTIEPCSMCLGAASWAGLSKVVFGAYQEDSADNPYEIKDYHAEKHAEKLSSSIKVTGGILREECTQLLHNYHNWLPKDNA